MSTLRSHLPPPLPMFLEQIVENTLNRYAATHLWQRESSITTGLLVDLKMAFATRPLATLSRARALFDCFDFTGSEEQTHGDIGILVKLTLSSGTTLIGFSSLEAKRSYAETGKEKYAEIRFDQLKRHRDSNKHHHVLLYSQEPVTLSPDQPAVRALVVPTDLVISLHTRTAAIEASAVRFAAQFERYLLGHDLDFAADVVEKARRGEKPYAHFLAAHISYNQHVSLSLSDLVPNQAIYRRNGPDLALLQNPLRPPHDPDGPAAPRPLPTPKPKGPSHGMSP